MLFWISFIIVIFILLCLSTEGPKQYRRLFRLSAIYIIVIISIFRFDVGFDYRAYYEMLAPTFEPERVGKFELFDKLIFYVANDIGFPPSAFIALGLITYIFVFYALYHYTHSFTLAVLTYLAFFYTTSLGPIRQGAAIAIILYAYKFLINRKIYKYFLCCIIAFLFHKSSIICFFFPIIYKYFNFKILIISSASLFLLFRGIMYIIDTYLGYGQYLDILNEMEGGSILKYFFLVLNITFLLLTRKQKSIREYRLFYLTTFGSLIPFLFGGHLGGRISWYFMCYLCIILPNYIITRSLTIRRIYAFFLCGFFSLTIWISTKNPVKTPYTPYQTIFSIEDYDRPKFKQEHGL